MILEEQKQSIRTRLKTYCDTHRSKAEAWKTLKLKSVSLKKFYCALGEKYPEIQAETWHKLDRSLNRAKACWQGVQTRDFKLLHALLEDAQRYSNVFAVTGAAGSGKSFCLKAYQKAHEETYLLACSEYWNRKHFLVELLRCLGRNYMGMNTAELMDAAVGYLSRGEAPLLLLDEGDKLTDKVLYFFITLYNRLEDRCGIVICATNYLQTRIRRGLHYNKKGYQEFYSRIGRRFIELEGIGYSDVYQVCMANGIEDKKQVRDLFESAQGDLRRVKRRIHALKRATNDMFQLDDKAKESHGSARVSQ